MASILSVHSFRGGTGKSSITASLAVGLAGRGHRVAVVDTDIQSPGIHVLFGLGQDQDQEPAGATLNDYLWGRRPIVDAARAVALDGPGRLWVLPASLKTVEIARILKEGYDVGRLNDGFRDLIEGLTLDFLLIDTHPGLNEETLLSIAISDLFLLVLRPDEQDYLGSAVTVEVARRLAVPAMHLILNKVPASFDSEEVRRAVEEAYGCPVAAVLPQSDAMMQLSSRGVFVRHYPGDPLSRKLDDLANWVAQTARAAAGPGQALP